MSKQRPCRQCREMFTVSCGGQRYCPTCRKVRAAVEDARCERVRQKHLARYGTCAECNEPAVCEKGLCLLHRAKATQQRIRQQRREYLRHFYQLPREEKEEHLARALAWLFDYISGPSVATEATSPEEQPHREQAAIDATFYELMGDIDL
jgi:hypothetical protein